MQRKIFLLVVIFLISCECIIAFPRSISGRSCWYILLPSETEPPSPVEKATEVGIAVTRGLGVTAVVPSTIAQSTRSSIFLRLSGCDKATDDLNDVSWIDSPTGLNIGNSDISEHIGSVVGNWILFIGTSGAWYLITKITGISSRLPGAFMVPGMFLYTSITTSELVLIFYGSPWQVALGVVSLGSQAFGTTLVTRALLPRHFHATFDTEDGTGRWVDAKDWQGYVKSFGIFFGDYGKARQWFISPEMVMSFIAGVLQYNQVTHTAECGTILATAAASNLIYATTLILLRPHNERGEGIFCLGIGIVQGLTLGTQAIVSFVASNETKAVVNTAAEYIMTAVNGILLIKSFYDLSAKAYARYNKHHGNLKLPTTNENDLTTPMLGDSYQELTAIAVVPPQDIPTPQTITVKEKEAFNRDVAKILLEQDVFLLTESINKQPTVFTQEELLMLEKKINDILELFQQNIKTLSKEEQVVLKQGIAKKIQNQPLPDVPVPEEVYARNLNIARALFGKLMQQIVEEGQ